jgi:predicted dehydrogenase
MSLRVLVAGVGVMGSSHTKGYARIPGFEVAGFVVEHNVDRAKQLAARLGLEIPVYTDFSKALKQVKPDVASINTLTDMHARFAIQAMRQGCHVFVEKPLGMTVAEAEETARVVRETGRKLVVGYILRVHPAWTKFIELAQGLGKPLIMRMNLNQQSYGHEWETHKAFIRNTPPLVDCGVHYVDVMCQMTRSRPVLVQGIGARVTDEIAHDAHNYGALQVVFEDLSVGWYEVGWGPMMSKVAFFVKDVIGPKGSVSIDKDTRSIDPAAVSGHAKVESIILHSGARNADGGPATEDQVIRIDDEPDHDELCKREQERLLKAIQSDEDLSSHIQDAVNSLRICFAGVESYKTGRAIRLL